MIHHLRQQTTTMRVNKGRAGGLRFSWAEAAANLHNECSITCHSLLLTNAGLTIHTEQKSATLDKDDSDVVAYNKISACRCTGSAFPGG